MKPKQKPDAIVSSSKQQDVVASMNEHFRQTGTFRAADVIRVLGNPLDAVEVRSAEGMFLTAKPERA
jgi:hypothetical protein